MTFASVLPNSSPPNIIFSLLLAVVILAITVTDIRRFIIPDILSLPAIPAGLAVTAYLAPAGEGAGLLLWHVAAMAFGTLAFYVIRWGYHRYRGQEGLGLGDVKLSAVRSH